MSESREEKREGRKRTEVPASPLNPVKLELALALVLGVSLLLVAPRLFPEAGDQLLALAAYGGLAALWITLRTRAILRRHRAGGEF